MSEGKQYFPALTGLRAVAAFLVFAHHTMSQAQNSRNPLDLLSQEGHMGVSIFFVLSGFLIGIRYFNSFTQNGLAGWKKYFFHRFARLYPVYLVCTVLTLLYNPKPLGVWVLNFAMMQGFFEEVAFTGIGVGWSLTVEVCFYAIAPLVMFYWNRLGLLGWTLLTFLAGGILVALGELPLPYSFVPDFNYMVRTTFFGRCLEFYLGLALARVWLVRYSSNSSAHKTSLGLFTYAGAVGVLGCMFALAYVRGENPRSMDQDQVILFNVLNNYVLPWFIGSLLLGLAKEKTLLSALLGSRIGQELGKGSYIFYLIHFKLGVSLLYGQFWPNRLGICLLIAVLSIIGYYVAEAPLQKKLLQLSKSRRIAETKSA
ncbi:acyltransferase family protein [Sabulibacter ruber]|uniref:acyltransferase family protein n=1 Tax=Sabulibacter ruber TaxID=2811901 RepID=UPI001A974957|nr:acyltransferase [Sabulibacter ruber]